MRKIWISQISRPGYLGKKRDEIFHFWDETYGKGEWRLIWQFGEAVVDFLGACAVYEDAYFIFLNSHPDLLEQLVKEAVNVYDDSPTNVDSLFDYQVQETDRTHIQDIAIRRALVRMGKWFKGGELIRIRQEKGKHPLSIALSPGKVSFHRLELIEKPELTGWWNPGSVESFYQSNRYLQTKIKI